MAPRHNQEIILHLHRLLRRTLRQPRTLALPEELRAREPQLHIREVKAEANARACAEGVESLLRFGADAVVQPAGGEESADALESVSLGGR